METMYSCTLVKQTIKPLRKGYPSMMIGLSGKHLTFNFTWGDWVDQNQQPIKTGLSRLIMPKQG